MRKSLFPFVLPVLVLGLAACGATPEPQTTMTAPVESPSPESTISGGGFTDGDCTGNNVTIDQDDTNAVLSGDCGAVTISGSGVFVTIEKAESVTVTGSKIDVVVSESVGAITMGGDQASYNGGDATSLSVSGSNVSVTLNDVGSVDVSGSNNFVVWSSGAASATDTGSGNTVVAP